MNKYEEAVRTWVSRRTGESVKDISNVEFAVIYGGYCETCGYETSGVTYKLNGNEYKKLETGEMSATEFFTECSEILKGLE